AIHPSRWRRRLGSLAPNQGARELPRVPARPTRRILIPYRHLHLDPGSKELWRAREGRGHAALPRVVSGRWPGGLRGAGLRAATPLGGPAGVAGSAQDSVRSVRVSHRWEGFAAPQSASLAALFKKPREKLNS